MTSLLSLYYPKTANRSRSPRLFRDFEHLFGDIDSWFQPGSAWGAPRDASSTPAARSVHPSTNVQEVDDEYRIVLDVPGVDKENISVSLDGDVLTLTAVRHPDTPEAVRYVRTFSLPDGVDRDRVDAALSQGVLTLKLPKREAAKPRAIEVRAA